MAEIEGTWKGCEGIEPSCYVGMKAVAPQAMILSLKKHRASGILQAEEEYN